MRTARVIQALGARIVGIQELGTYHARPDIIGSMQIDTITRETGMSVVTGPTIHHQNSTYGNCLLTHEPVAAVRRVNLTETGCEPRGLLDVDLTIDGSPLRVMVTHLGLRSWERRRQVRRLLNHLGGETDIPTVIMGDFNEWFSLSRALRCIHKRCGKSTALPTFPSRLPLLALDRIWMMPNRQLREVRVVKTPDVRMASDHLPLVATLRLDGPSALKQDPPNVLETSAAG